MYSQPNRNWPIEQESPGIVDSNGQIISEGWPKYYDHLRNQITEEEYTRLLNEVENAEPVLLSPKERGIDYVDGYFGGHAAENVRMLAQIAKNTQKRFLSWPEEILPE